MPDIGAKLSLRALNRATLARQMLLVREPIGVVQALRRVVALQAQQPASPYIALWNRIERFDPAELDGAIASFEVIKAHMMRLTLHLVAADDYRPFREATEPSLRGARLGDRRFLQTGLTIAEADALTLELLSFVDTPRPATACEEWLKRRLGGRFHPGAWWALRQYAPLLRAPTGGPWSFETRLEYVAPNPVPILADEGAADEALTKLILRYLEGFGPASVADIAQFAMVQRSRVKRALTAAAGDLQRFEGPDGKELLDVPGGLRPDEDVPAPPRLMAMWDSTLLAYHDRSRVIPPEYRKQIIRVNGDVLPTLLVDGRAVGVWRVGDRGIEARAFEPLTGEEWDGLAAEARSLQSLLYDRDPAAYRRFDHWWNKLAEGEKRYL